LGADHQHFSGVNEILFTPHTQLEIRRQAKNTRVAARHPSLRKSAISHHIIEELAYAAHFYHHDFEQLHKITFNPIIHDLL
jgi:hypothetical protein